MHRLKIISLCISLCLPFFICGQNPPCSSIEYNQFDFWEGKWEVLDTNGVKIGENNISKQYNNCLLIEEWQSTSLNKGTSYNYFSPIDSSWNQLWIDNQGGVLELKGKMEGKQMVLRSKPFKRQDIQVYNQIRWVNHDTNTVKQIWELYSIEGLQQSTLFHGIYKRKKE
ncbi:MAG: hypothetical protein CMO34_08015 [Verrucomicrobia bacterium]|nr:hypothetical protein [Verrucomicrobiota bacterium]|tara:strand:+ start:227 stop:733 length:507 start_codon:yes stop_codon:yes gene_type:complete